MPVLSGNEGVMVFLVVCVIELDLGNDLGKHSPVHRRLPVFALGGAELPQFV